METKVKQHVKTWLWCFGWLFLVDFCSFLWWFEVASCSTSSDMPSDHKPCGKYCRKHKYHRNQHSASKKIECLDRGIDVTTESDSDEEQSESNDHKDIFQNKVPRPLTLTLTLKGSEIVQAWQGENPCTNGGASIYGKGVLGWFCEYSVRFFVILCALRSDNFLQKSHVFRILRL